MLPGSWRPGLAPSLCATIGDVSAPRLTRRTTCGSGAVHRRLEPSKYAKPVRIERLLDGPSQVLFSEFAGSQGCTFRVIPPIIGCDVRLDLMQGDQQWTGAMRTARGLVRLLGCDGPGSDGTRQELLTWSAEESCQTDQPPPDGPPSSSGSPGRSYSKRVPLEVFVKAWSPVRTSTAPSFACGAMSSARAAQGPSWIRRSQAASRELRGAEMRFRCRTTVSLRDHASTRTHVSRCHTVDG